MILHLFTSVLQYFTNLKKNVRLVYQSNHFTFAIDMYIDFFLNSKKNCKKLFLTKEYEYEVIINNFFYFEVSIFENNENIN